MSHDSQPTLPFQSAIHPEVLDCTHTIPFRCHPDIACFNACCKQADVTLTPYDVIRLKHRLQLDSSAFLEQYTVPFQMDSDGLPGIKLKTDNTGACLQLAGDSGCGVYSDRPTVCRYYPIALLALKEKDAKTSKEQYSLITEPHCLGHQTDRRIAIDDYRQEQGVVEYDDMNRPWYQLILKKKSAGPSIGQLPQPSLQLFFMACYDLDRFRRFVCSDNFRATYQLPADFYAELAQSDEELLQFGYRFLRQVLFGEHSIQEAADAWEKRVEQRREVWELRRQLEIARRAAAEDAKYECASDAPNSSCQGD
ncbi:YkgJ family cysteine cluster protein [Rhodopseudomonas palustris]|uniref:YkgJ family cysteine cluster protein n=1 Tax=Thiospirillum jenense TaxID=1653858 RepID=A0A839HK64_9GAMM|nr:YkgJ family cysteine cluster protein [Thiospirillum jenense]MBB1093586.1 YkgJ family cysteine cluster protein [Rhodopseudomonas palustris]MBB1127266.1 YkgJ family cysteine cluster protein [Thiospirillum jenense]